jgi:hypothetical protein
VFRSTLLCIFERILQMKVLVQWLRSSVGKFVRQTKRAAWKFGFGLALQNFQIEWGCSIDFNALRRIFNHQSHFQLNEEGRS